MLEVKNLDFSYKKKEKWYRKKKESKGYEKLFGLHNINFKLEKGYLMGLLGFNGSGKSTLMNLLCGVYIPDGGSVTFHGKEVSAHKNEIMQKVAMVSDDCEFLLYRTLVENVRLFGILYDEYDEALWRKYMVQFGFRVGDLELCYDDLSTGQKRKFQLAFALARKPELLLLDEPTASLDPHARVEWMELLLTLIGKEEMSVILATHLTSELDEVADYILVMKDGEQLAFLDREEMVDQYGELELADLMMELDEEK